MTAFHAIIGRDFRERLRLGSTNPDAVTKLLSLDSSRFAGESSVHIFALFELHLIYLAFLRLIQEQDSSCENVSFFNTHLSRLNFEGTAKLKFVTLSTLNHFVACVTQAICLTT